MPVLLAIVLTGIPLVLLWHVLKDDYAPWLQRQQERQRDERAAAANEARQRACHFTPAYEHVRQQEEEQARQRAEAERLAKLQTQPSRYNAYGEIISE